MSRDVGSYAADKTTQLKDAAAVKSGGGFKRALDLPQNRITSERSDGKGPSNINMNRPMPKMKMGKGTSMREALGDIKQSNIS